jgi:hypothetical protein
MQALKPSLNATYASYRLRFMRKFSSEQRNPISQLSNVCQEKEKKKDILDLVEDS